MDRCFACDDRTPLMLGYQIGYLTEDVSTEQCPIPVQSYLGFSTGHRTDRFVIE